MICNWGVKTLGRTIDLKDLIRDFKTSITTNARGGHANAVTVTH